MNIDNYLSLLLLESYNKNKSINPYQEICEYSVLYFKYLSDEDKKAYIKIFGFHPLQLKKWISKSNINNYRNLDYFIFVIVLQYLLLKSILEIYKSGKIEKTINKFEKVLTNKISNNEVKENIKNIFKNNKQNQQEEVEKQRKQQEKENLEKQKEKLQKEKENLENTINLEEDKKREIKVVNELLNTYIEKLNNLNLEL
jgi:hypothetical protein